MNNARLFLFASTIEDLGGKLLVPIRDPVFISEREYARTRFIFIRNLLVNEG